MGVTVIESEEDYCNYYCLKNPKVALGGNRNHEATLKEQDRVLCIF